LSDLVRDEVAGWPALANTALVHVSGRSQLGPGSGGGGDGEVFAASIMAGNDAGLGLTKHRRCALGWAGTWPPEVHPMGV